MRKILLSVFTIALFSTFSFAQSITVHNQDEGNLDSTNDTIEVYVDMRTGKAELHLSAFNTTANALYLKVKKEYKFIVDGVDDDFCWKSCYTPLVMVSPDSIIVNAEAYSPQGGSGFLAHYHAYETFGTSIIDYAFFDVNNEEVEYKTTVKWIHEATNVNEKELVSFSNLYPNPANNEVTFTCNLNNNSNGYVVVTDILGSKVMDLQLSNTSGKQAINTSALNSGAYFCTFVVNDNIVKTSKLIVSH